MKQFNIIISILFIVAIILYFLDYNVEVTGFILVITLLISYLILKLFKGLPKG